MIYFLHDFHSARRTFWKTFQDTLCSIGDVSTREKPLQYPRDVGRRDLIRIGGDMHKAMGIIAGDIEAQHGRTARIAEAREVDSW